MVRQIGHIEAIAGNREIVRLHECACPEFMAHQHVAADRDALTRGDSVDRMQLFAEARVPPSGI